MAVLPASKIVTVREAAAYFSVDPVTVRRWIVSGGPVLRRGRRGPQNGALVDLQQMASWLGRAHPPKEQPHEDIMPLFAQVLLESLTTAHADIRAGVSRDDASAVLIVAWERLCTTMGKSYAFDQQPAAIQTLMSEL